MMSLTEKLIELYNTLSLIETKGANTIKMANCLCCISNLISEIENKKGEYNNEQQNIERNHN